MNSKTLLLTVIAVLSFFMATESHALAINNACKELTSKALEDAQQKTEAATPDNRNWRTSVVNFLKSALELFDKAYIHPTLLNTVLNNPHMVTIDSGNAIVLNCDDSLVEETLYYPIGLQVKALGTLELPNKGVRRTHYYVVTEYGLRIFIPASHLEEISGDSVYFFRNGPGSHFYCKSMAASCDPTAADPSKNPSLHPDYGYAKRKLDAALKTRVAIHETLLPERLPFDDSSETPEEIRAALMKELTRAAGEPTFLEQALASVCTSFPVTHYEDGGEIGYQKANFNLCRKPNEGELITDSSFLVEGVEPPNLSLAGVKIVTLDSSKVVFSSSLDGSFQRFAYDFDDLKRKIKRALDITMVVRKECGDTLVEERSFSLGGSINADVDLSVISADGSLKRTSLKAIKKRVNEKQYYLYSTYTLAPLKRVTPYDAGAKEQGSKQGIYDIQTIASCESDQPQHAQSIVIYHPIFLGDHLPLATKKDLISEYTKRYKDYGFASLEDPAYLTLGKVWRSKGSEQYYMWRDVLRSRLADAPQVRNLLHSVDKAQHNQVIDFFAHLTMASAINFE